MVSRARCFAAAATLALVGGVGTVGALSASAATPSCGHNCIDIFSRAFGTHRTPNFVLDVLRQGAKVGQPIILFRTSNTDPAEDFVAVVPGHDVRLLRAPASCRLRWRCTTAAAPSALAELCASTASRTTRRSSSSTRRSAWTAACAWALPRPRCQGRASPSSRVASRPRPSGSSTSTTPRPPSTHGYVPLINGSDTNFSHPFVLTYPANGFPTDKPRPQLITNNLTGFSHGTRHPDRLRRRQPALGR